MPEPHGLHPATPCCPPVARSSHRPLPVPHGPGACRSPLRALPRGAGSPVLRPRAQGHRTQMAAPKPRQPQRPLCDPAAGGGAWGVVPDAFSTRACDTHTRACLPWLAATVLSERRGACCLGGTEHSPGLFPPACWCRLAQRRQDVLGQRLGDQGWASHTRGREASAPDRPRHQHPYVANRRETRDSSFEF